MTFGCPRVQAQETVGPEVLELFFQLGLPDTRGAKWVRAGFGRGREARMVVGSAELTGNAWLLREESDGMVEVVLGQTARLRFRKATAESPAQGRRPDAQIPSIQIQPADLEQDLAVLRKAFKLPRAEADQTLKEEEEEKGTPPDEGDFEAYEARQDPAAAAARRAATSFLFLAHLHRQGRAAVVKDVLPALLQQTPTADQAIDAAIDGIGEARFSMLTTTWLETGDDAAYVTGLERLTNELSRGWNNRAAVSELTRRLKAAQSPSKSPAPGTLDASTFLRGLSREQIRQLPFGQNWLLAGTAAPNPDPFGNMGYVSADEELSESEPGEESESDDGADKGSGSAPDPAKEFFRDKRKAATALVEALNDQRFLRVSVRDLSQNSYGGGLLSGDPIERAYGQLARPIQMGELAWRLLEGVVPSSSRAAVTLSSDRAAALSDWLEQIASRSDEDLAWDYARGASAAYDPAFQASIRFLVAQGSEATMAKLREVFLDPSVWRMADSVTPLLEPYLQKLGGEAPAFLEEVKVVVKGMQQGDDSQDSDVSDALRELDRLLKPARLQDLLAEVAASDDEEKMGELYGHLQRALRKAPPAEAIPAILQAAAAAKLETTKEALVEDLQGLNARASKKSNPSYDDATRAALSKLLRDETRTTAYDGSKSVATIASTVAGAILWPTLTEAEQARWNELEGKAGRLVAEWLKVGAQAMADEKPLPPIPDGKKISAEQTTKLVEELARLDPRSIIERFRTETSDAQVALIEHLFALKEWPPALRGAQHFIVEVTGESAQEFPAEKWRGRPLDAALEAEITQSIEAGLQTEKAFEVSVARLSPLSGLIVEVKNARSIPPAAIKGMQIPGMTKRPVPVGILYRMLTVGQGVEMVRTYFGYPIWPDAAVGLSWRKEYGQDVPAERPSPEDRRFVANPHAFEKARREILESPVPFPLITFTWHGASVKDEPESER